MDNSALAAAIRERIVAELSKSATTNTASITDDCEKENNIVREGIIVELAKSNKPSRHCDVKDASIQTDKEEYAANNNHTESNTLIEQRHIEIERECEQRLRREMNAKLRVSAKQQAMQAMSRLERKHKDECRLLQKQLVEERSRSKHRERELLQVISQQQLSGQKELKEITQKLERERLETATLESDLGLLNDKMKELQIQRFSDNEKSERALTQSMNNLEQQKRQFLIGVAEAVRERDKFQLMLAKERDTILQKTKQFEDAKGELIDMERKLGKTKSALDAKISESTALRGLLKQCQSALVSLSYNDESSPSHAEKTHVDIPQTFEQKATTLTPTIQPSCVPVLKEQQDRSAAQPLNNNIIDKESCHETIEKPGPSRQDPPCTSLRDPPEEGLDKNSVKKIISVPVPNEIGLLDSYSNPDGSSAGGSPSPVHEEQLKAADTSQNHPTETQSDTDPCRSIEGHKPVAEEHNDLVLDDKGNMSPEQCPSSKSEIKKTTPGDESASSAICDDEPSELNNDIISDSESTGTDEYSMGTFCDLSTVEDHKLDKLGRIGYLHIK